MSVSIDLTLERMVSSIGVAEVLDILLRTGRTTLRQNNCRICGSC